MYNEKASEYLNALCEVNGGRRLGSKGNNEATDHVASKLKSMGYIIDNTSFPCLDYESGSVALTCEDKKYDVHISPLSNGCDVTAKLVTASTIEEMEKLECKGKILLMKGELCAEPLMPKNYPFYNPEHHRKIYSLVEQIAPAAIITATGRNPQMAAALYPYPVFEDGDFDIPSVYCTDVVGDVIGEKAGCIFHLSIDARRISSTGHNVIARKNPDAAQKVVICSHIDAKDNTAGALDNASGVTACLLLAGMLKKYNGRIGIEIIAFNGEDYYNPAGELDYLSRYGDSLSKILLGVNIDGAGYLDGRTAYSFYGVKKPMEKRARKAFAGDGFVEGLQWYQGDHMVFVQNGVPAIAITSEKLAKIMSGITHTPKDTPENVDPMKLVETAEALYALIAGMKVLAAPKQVISR